MVTRLQFQNMTKHFGGVTALRDVSFDVAPATVHAIVGENGAGKSTLMKILAGVYQPNVGTMQLDGAPYHPRSPHDAMKRGVAIVHQELALVPHLSVAENVFLGRLPAAQIIGTIHRRELRRQFRALFDRLQLDIPGDVAAEKLSVAQQQMVEIGRALSLNARVLVLDEPSAVLTPQEVENLFRFVRELVRQHVSVLYISHRLDEIFELADSVTVLRDGTHVSTRPIADVTRQQLIHDTVGHELSGQFPPRDCTIGKPLLQVRDLSSRRRFQNVSFDVRAGEVLGLTGLVGSGRSSVARAIFGDAPITGGAITACDTPGPFHNPKTARRAHIALVPEDRKREGLLLHRSLRENLTLGHLDDVSGVGVVNQRAELMTARRLSERHRIKHGGINAPINRLSGGNQQKALIARWLRDAYRIILLDEPTRGVDVGAKAEIYALINSLAERGAAILMISSELPEVIAMCDRIAVMHEGRLAGILDNAQRNVTQPQIMALAIGEAVA